MKSVVLTEKQLKAYINREVKKMLVEAGPQDLPREDSFIPRRVSSEIHFDKAEGINNHEGEDIQSEITPHEIAMNKELHARELVSNPSKPGGKYGVSAPSLGALQRGHGSEQRDSEGNLIGYKFHETDDKQLTTDANKHNNVRKIAGKYGYDVHWRQSHMSFINKLGQRESMPWEYGVFVKNTGYKKIGSIYL